MTPSEFVESEEWMEKSRDILWEAFAVVFPLIIYCVSLFLAEYWIGIEHARFSYLSEIPDAWFGACILLSFSCIRGFSLKRKKIDISEKSLDRSLSRYNLLSLGFLIGTTLLASASVMKHSYYSLGFGAIAMYFAFRIFKRITFLVAYLERRHSITAPVY
jgi:hypothetical protein